MLDFDINNILKKGRKTNNKLKKHFFKWFIKHYFSCDIHVETNIADTVLFAHNGLGCVVNKDSIIKDNCIIQHHVTIGKKNSEDMAPIINEGVYIGTGCLIIGSIEIGENAKIAAGAVVIDNVPPYSTVAGIPAKVVKGGKK